MTTKLTDSQKQTIRIALAKWMGWKGGFNISMEPVNNLGRVIPNYHASLDACHEIELKLTDEQFEAYQRALWVVVKVGNSNFPARSMLSAIAEHRSLALYRALNLGELGD